MLGNCERRDGLDIRPCADENGDMSWKKLLTYISGSVDEELLKRNEYLGTDALCPNSRLIIIRNALIKASATCCSSRRGPRELQVRPSNAGRDLAVCSVSTTERPHEYFDHTGTTSTGKTYGAQPLSRMVMVYLEGSF